LTVAEIAEHDIGPANAQAPALVDARHGLDVALHSGQQSAYTARPVLHRRIHGQHRTGFRRAITFQEPHAEFVRPSAACFFLQFFSAGKHITGAVEIVRMGKAAVSGKKCIGAEQKRDIILISGLWNPTVVQRRGVEEYLDGAK